MERNHKRVFCALTLAGLAWWGSVAFERRSAGEGLARDQAAVVTREDSQTLVVPGGTPDSTELRVPIASGDTDDFDFPHRAYSFAAVLEDVDDPRFADVAARCFDDRRAAGQVSSYDVQGYLRIIARNGGGSGARTIIELLSDSEVGLQLLAGECVAELDDPTLASELFDMLREFDPLERQKGRSILEGMASWRDPRVQQRLWDLANDPSVDYRLQGDAVRAFGAQMSAAELSGIVAGLHADPSHRGIDRVMSALESAAKSKTLNARELSAASESFLREMVSDDDVGVRRNARSLLQSHPTLCSPGCRAELERLVLDATLDPSEREDYRYLLSKLDDKR